MIRNVTVFAVFAFLAVIGFRLLGAIFGGLLGLILTVIWWAFIGYVIYSIIRMFSPDTAQKIRETIRGDQRP